MVTMKNDSVQTVTDSPGYVGRDKFVQLWDQPDGYDYLMDPKRRRRERRFTSREEALRYLREEMYYATDDMRFFYWFPYSDDLPYHILDGSPVEKLKPN
jgi:hypothetical protein